MELVDEVRSAVHASANAEFAAWVADRGGLDVRPVTLPVEGLEAWVIGPREARPPVGFLVVRAAGALQLTTGDAAAAGRVLAALPSLPGDAALPHLLFALLRSRSRTMALCAEPPPSVTRDGAVVEVRAAVDRGPLPQQTWSLRWDGVTLTWTVTGGTRG
ncbi:MAG: hypothetical protein RLZZ299_3166 [Pseudomonadota bacterium]|jgi:hypothetical protein